MSSSTFEQALRCILLGVLLLCGCGDSSPTQPDPEPQTVQMLEWTTTVVSFECLVDGDGIEGAGDFTWWTTLSGETRNYETTLSSGKSTPVNFSYSGSARYSGNPLLRTVHFTCTEWDQDIAGNVYPDSDMNNRAARADEYIPAAPITNYITLGNSNCKVRLHYTITSKVVERQI